MKYEYGMMAYNIKKYKKDKYLTQPTIFQIMKYDEKKNKYICLSTDECCFEDDSTALRLFSEDELELYENLDKEYAIDMKEFFNKEFPKDLNLYCYDLYDCEDGECVLYRNAFLRKKNPNDKIKYSIKDRF